MKDNINGLFWEITTLFSKSTELQIEQSENNNERSKCVMPSIIYISLNFCVTQIYFWKEIASFEPSCDQNGKLSYCLEHRELVYSVVPIVLKVGYLL